MGSCKDNMQASTPKAQGIFDRLRSKKPKPAAQSDVEVAKTFVDHVCHADEKIEELIASKQKDVANEPGKEKENKKKLRVLEQMQQRLSEIADLAQEYNKWESGSSDSTPKSKRSSSTKKAESGKSLKALLRNFAKSK